MVAVALAPDHKGRCSRVTGPARSAVRKSLNFRLIQTRAVLTNSNVRSVIGKVGRPAIIGDRTNKKPLRNAEGFFLAKLLSPTNRAKARSKKDKKDRVRDAVAAGIAFSPADGRFSFVPLPKAARLL
jgi:hypothetical protein